MLITGPREATVTLDIERYNSIEFIEDAMTGMQAVNGDLVLPVTWSNNGGVVTGSCEKQSFSFRASANFSTKCYVRLYNNSSGLFPNPSMEGDPVLYLHQNGNKIPAPSGTTGVEYPVSYSITKSIVGTITRNDFGVSVENIPLWTEAGRRTVGELRLTFIAEN